MKHNPQSDGISRIHCLEKDFGVGVRGINSKEVGKELNTISKMKHLDRGKEGKDD